MGKEQEPQAESRGRGCSPQIACKLDEQTFTMMVVRKLFSCIRLDWQNFLQNHPVHFTAMQLQKIVNNFLSLTHHNTYAFVGIQIPDTHFSVPPSITNRTGVHQVNIAFKCTNISQIALNDKGLAFPQQ